MSASKSRLRWIDVPLPPRAAVEAMVGGRIVHAESRPGGYSPGLASRLTLDNGRCMFVKAMDGDVWPSECEAHRIEATIAAALPAAVPAPRFIGSVDDGRWVALAFENVDGRMPEEPWTHAALTRAVSAVAQFADVATPSPIVLPHDHPRLGGWSEFGADKARRARLAQVSMWAADNVSNLAALEADGLRAAKGSSLVHFDLYPHNMLVTADRVVFVDWPHARLGAPLIDLIMVLSSAADDGIDPEPFIRTYASAADRTAIEAILAAHAGFLLAGGLAPAPPGLEAITAAKRRLGRGAVRWLERRRASPSTDTRHDSSIGADTDGAADNGSPDLS